MKDEIKRKWYAVPPYHSVNDPTSNMWAVLDEKGEYVASCETKEFCEHIVEIHNFLLSKQE